MPTQCIVNFDNNPNKIVYSDQYLSGAVILSLTKPKKLHGVYMKITGEAHAQCKRKHGDRYQEAAFGDEEHLYGKIDLVVCTGNQEAIILEPGEYRYPFQHYFPKHLPSSIEGDFGYIKYRATVVLDVVMWPNKEYEIPFTVIQTVDLNENAAHRRPLGINMETSFILWKYCSMSDLLAITVRSPVSAYVPGETINLEIIVDNRSSEPVLRFKVHLTREIIFHPEALTSTIIQQNDVISKTKTTGCDVNECRTIYANLIVPPTQPSDLTTSKLVMVRYYCDIIGCVSFFHRNAVLVLPITIGTRPFASEPSAPPYQFHADEDRQLYNEERPSQQPPTYKQAMDY